MYPQVFYVSYQSLHYSIRQLHYLFIIYSLRRAALEKWKQYSGPSATYRKLIVAFEHAGHRDFASKVYEIVGKYLIT